MITLQNIGRSQTNRKPIIGVWMGRGSGFFGTKVGKLENFLKIRKQGDAWKVHQSNVPNIYVTY